MIRFTLIESYGSPWRARAIDRLPTPGLTLSPQLFVATFARKPSVHMFVHNTFRYPENSLEVLAEARVRVRNVVAPQRKTSELLRKLRASPVVASPAHRELLQLRPVAREHVRTQRGRSNAAPVRPRVRSRLRGRRVNFVGWMPLPEAAISVSTCSKIDAICVG